MKLNTLNIKIKSQRRDLGVVLDLQRVKLQAEDIKDKNLDLVLQLKVSKEGKCLYIEDFQKEVLEVLKIIK